MKYFSLFLCGMVGFAGELENLGRQLFFDKRLSVDGTVSCAHCHRPDRAYADPNPVSRGVGGKVGERNAPSLVNRGDGTRFFWDGRAATLEEQAMGPLLNPVEMGNTEADLVRRVGSIREYALRFERAFGGAGVDLRRMVRALAAFERTLVSEGSLYDEWRRGRRERWTPEHEFGRQVFYGKGECGGCHAGPNFTNDVVVNVDGKTLKVPSLREVGRTAPYLHDGSVKTIEGVLERHAGGRELDEAERKAVVRFLESLSGEQ